jgi:hypothetical protein
VRLDLVDLCLEVAALGANDCEAAQVHLASELDGESGGRDGGCGLLRVLHAESGGSGVAKDGQ